MVEERKYSPNEGLIHKSIKDKLYKHFKFKLHQDIVKCETEHNLKTDKKKGPVIDLYIETSKYIIFVEVKTNSAAREGIMQLLRYNRYFKTKKQVILILAVNHITENIIYNALGERDKETRDKFIFLTYDDNLKIKRFTPKYKIA